MHCAVGRRLRTLPERFSVLTHTDWGLAVSPLENLSLVSVPGPTGSELSVSHL